MKTFVVKGPLNFYNDFIPIRFFCRAEIKYSKSIDREGERERGKNVICRDAVERMPNHFALSSLKSSMNNNGKSFLRIELEKVFCLISFRVSSIINKIKSPSFMINFLQLSVANNFPASGLKCQRTNNSCRISHKLQKQSIVCS